MPSATVYTKHGNGSGTAIKVDPILGTYLLTNYHVVKGNLDDLTVRFYKEEVRHTAYVHSIDVQNDIAVLIVRHQHEWVAKMGDPPEVFDEVLCVGASMGQPVAPSRGMVTGTDVQLFGTRYFTRMDCNIIGGNSGGGMYVLQEGEWRYVGMPSAIMSIPSGFSNVPVTFLGLSVRLVDIQHHLFQNGVLRIVPITP